MQRCSCGVHAVRSVEATGATRWEVRHGCWGGCPLLHVSFDEYADDRDHLYADSGSAVVSADGELVWSHVRGPLASDGNTEDDQELWVVLDAVAGRAVGRVNTGTMASCSEHTSHPDPSQMGLSLGEGEEGSPVLWGRWDGQQVTAEQIGTERILLAVSPSGRRLLTVPVGQWSLSLHQLEHSSKVSRKLDATDAVWRTRRTRARTGSTGILKRRSWTRTPSLPAPPSAMPSMGRSVTGWST